MLSKNDLVSLTHELQDPVNESSSSDDDSNFEFSSQFDNLIDSNLSSDPEKESHFSLSDSDKKELNSIYPSKIIFNEQFNMIFNISMTHRKMSDNQDQTKIDFKLKNCEDEIKKFDRKKKKDKKLNNQFLKYDLANRMILKKKILDMNFEEDKRLIGTKVLIDETNNIPYIMNNQENDKNFNKSLTLSAKNSTYSLVKNLDDMISNTHQKLKFSLDNKNNSQSNSNLLKNNQIECKQKSSEIDDFCLESKKIDHTVESNLLKRRNKPSLNLQKLPIDDGEVMPECLKKESPNKRFDTDDSKLETLIDRFARELSITKEKPTAIKSANDALNKSNLLNFDYIVTNNLSLKTAPPILSNFREQSNNFCFQNYLINRQSETGNEKEILIERLNSILVRDLIVKTVDIDKIISIIKNLLLKNFIQTESINNPFDDNELGIKTINICKLIHNQIKFLNFYRRKLLISVFMGNLNNEPLKFVSKCFWNDEKDRQISFFFTNGLFFCIINIFYVLY